MQQVNRNRSADTPERKDVYTVVTNRIIDLLQKGIVPWKPCVKDRRDALSLPMNGYSGHQYQGINVLILMGETLNKGYTTNRWFTMNQVNKLGARVQKGQKGTPIIFAKFIDKKEDGKVVLDKEGNPEQRYFLTYTDGWNGDQTTLAIDGGDDEGLDPELRQGQANDLLMAYIEREGITLTHVGDQAYYQPHEDLINLPDFSRALSPARWFESAFHESIHSTGHEKRLRRLEDEKALRWGDANYAREELVAELGAAYLLAALGIFEEEEQNLAEYIRNWIGVLQGNKNLIFQASSKAQTAAAYVKTGGVA